MKMDYWKECIDEALHDAGVKATEVMPWVNGRIKDVTGSFDLTYVIIISMMILSAILAVISRKLGHPKSVNSAV
jgi:hypothetical protein